MADESDVEKTESATPKRLEKAREEGQVARSRELTSFALLSAGFFGVWGLSHPISLHMESVMRGALTFNPADCRANTHFTCVMIGLIAAARYGRA